MASSGAIVNPTSSSSYTPFDPNNPYGQFGLDPSVASQLMFRGQGYQAQDQQVITGLQQFQQQFQNLLGRAPTSDELNAYASGPLSQAWLAPGDLSYGDSSGLASSYIQNTFGPQAAAYSQQQQTSQLGTDQNLLQNTVNQTMNNTASQLTDPTSQIYQTLSGSMNNAGITPSSGAFQAGAGSTIANAGLNAANAGLSALSLPAIENIGSTGQNPYQNSFGSGTTALGNLEGLNNFNLESQLAQQLAAGSGQSSGQNILGMATGSAQGLGSLLQGGSQAYKATWICTAMWRHGVLASCEVDRLHKHLFRAMFKRFWKFVGYFLIGKFVVLGAEWVKIDWEKWRSRFYDNVISEPDSVKAVDLYAQALYDLLSTVKHKLRVKFMVVYDNPMENRQ